MNNKGLIIALVGVGAILLLSQKKNKKRAYTIDVPPPTKITEQQFRQGTNIVQKALPAAKKVFSLFKKKPTAQQQATAAALSKGSILRGVGQFPDMC